MKTKSPGAPATNLPKKLGKNFSLGGGTAIVSNQLS
jgi:hypothetical protein